jgi:hypothetical protein
MLVLHRSGDDPGRWRGQERLDKMSAGLAQRRREIGTLRFDRSAPEIANFADRFGRAHIADRLFAGQLLLHHSLEERIAKGIGPCPALPRSPKPAHPVPDVEEKSLALLFAVVADVDLGFGLLAHHRSQRLAAQPLELGGVDRFPPRPAHIKACKFGWTRQAAGMGRQDAVFAAAHCHSFRLASWVSLSVARKRCAANAAIENKTACDAAVFFVG